MSDILVLVSEAWAQTSGTEVPAVQPIEVTLVQPPSPVLVRAMAVLADRGDRGIGLRRFHLWHLDKVPI